MEDTVKFCFTKSNVTQQEKRNLFPLFSFIEMNKLTSQLLIILIVLTVYYSSIFSHFNSVDDLGMANGIWNSSFPGLRALFFPQGGGGYYRPMIGLSFFWDKFAWGLESSFMHLENVVLHMFNAMLVYAIACRLTESEDRQKWSVTALAAALLFALHPVNTEPVNWISGRTDVLAGFFILVALLLFLSGMDKKNKVSHKGYILLGGLSILLGCWTKETALFFVPAAMLSFLYFNPDKSELNSFRGVILQVRENLFFLSVILVTSLGYLAARRVAFVRKDTLLSDNLPKIVPASSVELSSELAMIIRTLGFYLKKLVVPLPLNFGIIHIDGYYLYPGIVGLIMVAYILWRRNRMTLMFLSAFCLVFPALLVPLLRATWTPVAERYLYIPSAFFAIGTVMVMQRTVFSSALKVPLFSLVAVVILWEGYETYERNLVWQDNELLFRDTLTKSPDFLPAQNDLAAALQGKGRIEEAAALLNSLNKDVTINHFQIGEINKAVALAHQGKAADARARLIGLLNNPGNFRLKILQTLLHLDEERLPHTQKGERTELMLDMAAQLKKIYEESNDPVFMYRLGQIYTGLNSFDEAGRAYRIAADRAPGDAFYKAPSNKLARKFGH